MKKAAMKVKMSQIRPAEYESSFDLLWTWSPTYMFMYMLSQILHNFSTGGLDIFMFPFFVFFSVL